MRLLVVDDSFTMRQLVIRSLRKGGLEFDEVLEAKDGIEALAFAKRRPPGLVISDLAMPKLDGIEFVKMLREFCHSEQTKVVLLTAQGSEATAENTKKAGANLFLTKPFSPDVLVQRIKSLLGLP